MAQGSQKRITKELTELLNSPPSGITVSLADESDIYKWKIVMDGPVDSPYALTICPTHCTAATLLLRVYTAHRPDTQVNVSSVSNEKRHQGGSFNLLLTLPPQYPFRPPTLTFTTKIYHPNISSGPSASITATGTSTPTEAGVMCLGMLRPEEWKPPTKISAVLEFARQLLREPNPDDAVEGRIAEELRRDRAAWEKEAKDWTKRYAMKK